MLKRLPFLVLIALPLGVAAQSETPDSAQFVLPDDTAPYVIRSGDKVTPRLFTAAGERESVLDGERIVDRAGDLYLPFVGELHVAGLTERDLRTLLVRRFSEFYDQPTIDLTIELRVSVTGAVGRAGQLFLDPTSTVIDAIAAAGGMTSEYAVTNLTLPSDPRAVRLVRADGTTLTLNLLPEEVLDEVLRLRVRSGDWIHVPTRGRSRVRDEITFWGGIVSFVGSLAALIVYVGGR